MLNDEPSMQSAIPVISQEFTFSKVLNMKVKKHSQNVFSASSDVTPDCQIYSFAELS